MGREFQDICTKSGIIHETTSPHTPKHNGVAERYNRTLQEEPSLSDTMPDSLADSGYLPYILSTSSRTVYCTHTSVYCLMKHSGERSPESIGSEPTAQNAGHSYQK